MSLNSLSRFLIPAAGLFLSLGACDDTVTDRALPQSRCQDPPCAWLSISTLGCHTSWVESGRNISIDIAATGQYEWMHGPPPQVIEVAVWVRPEAMELVWSPGTSSLSVGVDCDEDLTGDGFSSIEFDAAVTDALVERGGWSRVDARLMCPASEPRETMVVGVAGSLLTAALCGFSRIDGEACYFRYRPAEQPGPEHDTCVDPDVRPDDDGVGATIPRAEYFGELDMVDGLDLGR